MTARRTPAEPRPSPPRSPLSLSLPPTGCCCPTVRSGTRARNGSSPRRRYLRVTVWSLAFLVAPRRRRADRRALPPGLGGPAPPRGRDARTAGGLGLRFPPRHDHDHAVDESGVLGEDDQDRRHGERGRLLRSGRLVQLRHQGNPRLRRRRDLRQERRLPVQLGHPGRHVEARQRGEWCGGPQGLCRRRVARGQLRRQDRRHHPRSCVRGRLHVQSRRTREIQAARRRRAPIGTSRANSASGPAGRRAGTMAPATTPDWSRSSSGCSARPIPLQTPSPSIWAAARGR